MRMISYLIGLVLIALSCASCLDDPAQLEQRDRQQVEIAKLRAEIAGVDEKIARMPKNFSEELATAQQELEALNREIASLETQISELRAEKRSCLAEFDRYRAKYPLK